MEKVSHPFIKIKMCVAYKTPIGYFQDRVTANRLAPLSQMTGKQAAQDYEPWEKRNKWGETYYPFSFLPGFPKESAAGSGSWEAAGSGS